MRLLPVSDIQLSIPFCEFFNLILKSVPVLIPKDFDTSFIASLSIIAPVLGLALIVGLVVAILQAVTSIQEQTLTFLPKLLVILLAIALLGGLMFTSLSDYTIALFNRIPDFAK
jgi:flagellar biosynthetic protein FliQ